MARRRLCWGWVAVGVGACAREARGVYAQPCAVRLRAVRALGREKEEEETRGKNEEKNRREAGLRPESGILCYFSPWGLIFVGEVARSSLIIPISSPFSRFGPRGSRSDDRSNTLKRLQRKWLNTMWYLIPRLCVMGYVSLHGSSLRIGHGTSAAILCKEPFHYSQHKYCSIAFAILPSVAGA